MPIAEITFEMRGIDALVAKFQALKTIRQDIAAGAYLIAEEVMTLSKDVYVPVDTGTLKSSGFVRPPEITPESISVTIGYGGAARAYAWNQEYGGWHNLVVFGHPYGPYYPMHHPPKWAVEALANPKRHSAHVLARAAARLGAQIGQAHFLEDPFILARGHFYDEMNQILGAKIKELGLS